MSIVTKASAGRIADTRDFVVSDGSVDRHGDIIVQDGIDKTNFSKNPVALFMHNHTDPVGVWENLRRQGDATVGSLRMAAKGTSRTVDFALALMEQGILKAVSVSLIPKEKLYLEPRGIKYIKSELTEISLVTVGANANALMIAKNLGMTEDEVTKYFVAPVGGNDTVPPRIIQSDERIALQQKALDTIYRAKKTIHSARN